jgi:glycosyltransferase involved in cell wall biosynthesis
MTTHVQDVAAQPVGQALKQFKPRVLVIVPARDEAENIQRVLDGLSVHAAWADVVVIDDASRDATAALARARGVPVVRLPCHLGIGGAMQTGYQYAWERGYDVAVQFDGDGQHRPGLIAPLAEAVVLGRGDVVVGSRLVEGVRFRFHPMRFLGSWLLSRLVSLITRQRVTDPTSGFRAVSRPVIDFFRRHYPQTYLGDTAEALVWAARRRFRIAEIPARMRRRSGGTSAVSSLGGIWRTGCILLAVLIDCLEAKFPEEAAP